MMRKPDGKKSPGLTDGRFGVVPADVLIDTTISRSARWLFGLLCSHADKEGFCRRSIDRIANAEGVSRRAVQKWLFELEAAGRIVRHGDPGKMGLYQVIRISSEVPKARAKNIKLVLDRKVRYGPKRSKRVNDSSLGGEQQVTGTGVNHSLPEQDPYYNKTRRTESALDKLDADRSVASGDSRPAKCGGRESRLYGLRRVPERIPRSIRQKLADVVSWDVLMKATDPNDPDHKQAVEACKVGAKNLGIVWNDDILST